MGSFRRIVNSYDGLDSVNDPNAVRLRLGVSRKTVGSRRLALRNPDQLNANKNETDKARSAKVTRCDGTEESFLNLRSAIGWFERS